ncbi:tol-pal system protein YbgF [Limnobacter alexandrii]|uniref:tol-pal system protein YbgF n=1 Tax=Limnobacter alexandrii TaxID=2570352 RepID=UPI001108F160|nr:tol-pal system protein YbgF [Limnobacter alexandrii]
MTVNFKRQAWAVALFCAFASNSAFAIFDDTEARKAILDLRQQVKALEDRVARMEASNQGQLSLAQSLSDKDREIARLRGDLEVANNNIRKLQEDNRLLYTNLDDRLKKLEPRALQLDGEELTVPPEQFNDYQAGLDHFKAGNYKDAALQFQDFLGKYKQSKLEPQVRYFLGSTQFAQGEYKTALVTQRDLAKDFPDSPRAPDALLSMASSQLELKSIPGAKKTLGELITKYPGSPAAESAKARLEALK